MQEALQVAEEVHACAQSGLTAAELMTYPIAETEQVRVAAVHMRARRAAASNLLCAAARAAGQATADRRAQEARGRGRTLQEAWRWRGRRGGGRLRGRTAGGADQCWCQFTISMLPKSCKASKEG